MFLLAPLWSKAASVREARREAERETSTEAPGQAADRQTDVWADRQMMAPEDCFNPEQPAIHPDPALHHIASCTHCTITTAAEHSDFWVFF